MILAIDTSLGSGVAVVDLEGVVRSEAISADSLGHAEVIGTLIERALSEAFVGPADISHVAAGMGPGPFTGLRIGIAAARAFALGRGVPVIPVVSHDAAALTAASLVIATDAPSRIFAVTTDARRREVAISLYRIEPSGLPVRLEGPVLNARDGSDVRIEELCIDAETLTLGPCRPERIDVSLISPGALGQLAARALADGWPATHTTAALGPEASEPLYLRSPDVTVGHAPKRVST